MFSCVKDAKIYIKCHLDREMSHAMLYFAENTIGAFIRIDGLMNSRQIDASCAIGLKSTWIKKFHLSSPEASLVFRESYLDKLLCLRKKSEGKYNNTSL